MKKGGDDESFEFNLIDLVFLSGASYKNFIQLLRHDAASVIFADNHLSGVAEHSRADKSLTQALKQAFALVDVHVLDHFFVGHRSMLWFAARRLI